MKPRGMLPWLGVLAALLASTACTTNPASALFVTRSAKEREIAGLRAEFATQMDTLRSDHDRLVKSVTTAKDAQIAGAGNGLFAADAAFRTLLHPTRTDLIVNNYVNEAWTALGRPIPTYEQMEVIHKRLRDELDETKTSLEQLRVNHAAAVAQNQALAETTKKFESELRAVEEKRLRAEREFAGKLDAKQTELAGVLAKLADSEKERANERAALQALKTKFSIVLGIVALAAGACAIYLPVYRKESGAFAALCAAASIGIWWVQPWMIGAGVGAVLLVIFVVMAIKHWRQERLADGLVLANQRIKEKDPELWRTTLAPVVRDHLGKYREVEGEGISGAKPRTVVVPDSTMEALVDEKLKEYERI